MIVRAAILGVSLAFGAMAEEARRLRGVVVDESGAPVAEAFFHHTGSREVPRTDAAGRFHLVTAAPVVVVRTLDFESFAIRLPQEEPLRVVLKKPVRRPFRECSFHTILFRHGGPGALRFRKMTAWMRVPSFVMTTTSRGTIR